MRYFSAVLKGFHNLTDKECQLSEFFCVVWGEQPFGFWVVVLHLICRPIGFVFLRSVGIRISSVVHVLFCCGHTNGILDLVESAGYYM